MNNSLNTSDFSRELSLLLQIIGSGPWGEEDLEGVDWKEWIRLAHHHRVYPLLYMRLKERGYEGIPSSVMDSLYSKYSANVISMLRLSSEMEKINSALMEHQVEAIFLKGPVLAQQLYGDLSLRTSKDLDVLVSPKHLEKAEGILSELGYVTEDEKTLGSWKRKKHHISYVHPLYFTQVELHWRMSAELPGTSFRTLWDRRTTVSFSGRPIHYLSDGDLFMYLVSHGARHGWFRLRWLCDIDRMIQKKSFNVQKLMEHYRQRKERDLAGQAAILTNRLLSTPLGGDLEELSRNRYAEELARASLYFIKNPVDLSPNGDKDTLAYYKRYLHSLMSRKEKLSLIMDYLYPSTKDVSLLPLPKLLHFLYFPLRPFLWFWRYVFSKEPVNNG
ncbi:nucleotidyltransferase family protein [Paenibacillus favisporus]|uniref:nucleotidyltransferase domain-containing protein n=1 Tax=Paenibacillus favisporus TaxID=221028 RepID=UPI002DBBC201|nr:nucleotidyltransferase family protein [Paenibacillus favisporus]MEC0178123.1 nucleotidyltransferase family protein [Paenibacillus favisporus]